MSEQPVRVPDPTRTDLRNKVAAIESELARLGAAPAEEARSLSGLQASWSALVELMALGPEPEYRVCPSCGATGMRGASVCGFCWTKLPPL